MSHDGKFVAFSCLQCLSIVEETAWMAIFN